MKRTALSLKGKVFISVILLVILKIAFDIFRVPNYTAGHAYINSSLDGKYKAMTLFLNQDLDHSWTYFSLSFGDYAADVLFAIADASSGEILAFYHPPDSWRSSGSGGHWTCEGETERTCTSFRFPYFDDISVPPSWWKQTHAKLTVKLLGLENPQFKKVTIENDVQGN